MTTMNVRDIFDRNVNFKTRIQPCRIAVRADLEKSMYWKEKQTHFGDIWTSSEDHQDSSKPFGHPELRFTDNCPLKTDDLKRSCTLRFPYGTGLSSSNGLLEQMP